MADEVDWVSCCPFGREVSVMEVDSECFARGLGLSLFDSSGDLTCVGDSGSEIRSGNEVKPFGDIGGVVRVDSAL